MFKNRSQAGELLAKKLVEYKPLSPTVIGLTRGGVAVASEIAKNLAAPFGALVVKKISSPLDKELAIGAIAEDGITFIDWKLAGRSGADEAYIIAQTELFKTEIKKIEQRYHASDKYKKLTGKTVILTDDGVATGATIRAAIAWVHAKDAKSLILAVPVAPKNFLNQIKNDADNIVVLETPDDFQAVGQFYKEFPQMTDEEVISLLQKSSG